MIIKNQFTPVTDSTNYEAWEEEKNTIPTRLTPVSRHLSDGANFRPSSRTLA